ncbi:MAG: ferritin-like domain-containing protein [Verrucomicrobiota bacterium]|nr:ferritin-like domain-containing protein [Verrucomicrobiota bacterium]
MNHQLLDLVGNLNTKPSAAPTSRRDLFRQVAKHGGKIALAAATPFLGSGCAVIGAAIAPQTGLAKQTLAFAILLEELEHAFYVRALKSPGLIPASDRLVFEQIRKHEGAHVLFLNTGLTGIGGFPQSAPKFDFTGGGKYPGVFSDYRTFLEVSQMFEDTGVKAYKGQAGNLITSSKLLTAALRIHSVEARHAAEVRRLRGVNAWTGAFDEALSKEEVLAMVSPFIVGRS